MRRQPAEPDRPPAAVPRPMTSELKRSGTRRRRRVAWPRRSPSPPAWPSAARLGRRRPDPRTPPLRPARRPRHHRAASTPTCGRRAPATTCWQWYVDHGVDRVTPWGWDVGPRLRDGGLAAGVARAGAGDAVPDGSDRPRRPLERDRHQRPGGRRRRARRGQDRRAPAGAGARRPHAGRRTTSRAPSRPGSGRSRSTGSSTPRAAAGRRPRRGDRPATPTPPRSGSRPAPACCRRPRRPRLPRRWSQEQTYDAALVTARQHGDAVRLVVSVGLPDLDFVQPGLFRSESEALERNQDIVRAQHLDDWLPHVTTVEADGDVRERSSTATRRGDPRRRTPASAPWPSSGFDAGDPGGRRRDGCGHPERDGLLSTDHLYLASSAYRVGWEACCWDVPRPTSRRTLRRRAPPTSTPSRSTDRATYVGSGEVEGSVADRWAMDERRRRAAGGGRRHRRHRQLQLGGHASASATAPWSSSAASTGSASTSRSRRSAGSTTSRSW